MSSTADSSDRPGPLFIAIVLSLAVHLVFVGIWTLKSGARPLRPVERFKLVYQEPVAYKGQQSSLATRTQTASKRIVVPAPSSSRGAGGSVGTPGSKGARGFDLIERGELAQRLSSPGSGEGLGGAGGPGLSTTVDLTDVTAAAQGDPVRLTYFSVIREQVQQTADEQAVNMQDPGGGGTVYVTFVLDSSGQARTFGLMQNRTTAPPALCDIAMRLVNAASPFPAFPPSFKESSLTIWIPIEFAVPSPAS